MKKYILWGMEIDRMALFLALSKRYETFNMNLKQYVKKKMHYN